MSKQSVDDKKPKVITQEDMENAYDTFKKNLQRAMFYFIEDDKFVGTLFQEINLKTTLALPTAAMSFNPKTKTFEAYFNPFFFNMWDLEQQKGIIKHEIMHFTHDHLRRFDFSDKEKRELYNICADMAINQYIKALPPGGVNVNDFKLDSGEPFPKFRTTEEYIELIQNNKSAQDKVNQFKEKGKGNKKGTGDGEHTDDDGRGQHSDVHDWNELTEEEKKQAAEEMKTLIKRTMEKTQYGLDRVPGGIKDLLKTIDVFLDKFNAKKVLQDVIRKNASCSDRSNTWKKPNKRYGSYAPGTTLGKVPKLVIYQDTSGSRSTTELNVDRKIIDQFLKAGTRKCDLALWHTALYLKRKHKLNQELNPNEVQAGGTSINCVISDINANQPDLSIILTDGYYDWNGTKPKSEVLVVIVDKGEVNHPMKDIVKTIQLNNLKNN